MPTRAVIFDFGGVLCLHPNDQQIAAVSQEIGLPIPEFLKVFWENRLDYDAGLLTPHDYWHGVARAAGIEIDDSHLPHLVRLEIALWNRYDPRILAWVRQLQAQGIGTSILSNLPQPLGEELRSTPGFLDPFDQITFSYELGLVKPDRAIYEHATNGLNVAPSEALFLDDRRVNVEGAQAAGLASHRYTTWEDFLSSGLIARHHLPQPR